jgi:putative ABC transport system substrate-binding protein
VSAAAWRLAARAQQREPLRRVAVLDAIAVDTPLAQDDYSTFLNAFEQLGWTDGRNVQIEVRWAGGDEAKTRKYVEELVALTPDVILTLGSAAAEVMLKATRTIPIVFAVVPDPVGSGFVKRLSRPGSNATGFMLFEYNLCGKWLELLKEIAPRVTHAAVLRDPHFVAGIGQFAVIQAVAPSVGIEVSPVDLSEPAQIEDAIGTFAQSPNGGLILAASAIGAANFNLVITAAARYKLPAVYLQRRFVAAGGLSLTGRILLTNFNARQATLIAYYGAKNLLICQCKPQANMNSPINLKTAKALGLTIPPSLLARADEVIE